MDKFVLTLETQRPFRLQSSSVAHARTRIGMKANTVYGRRCQSHMVIAQIDISRDSVSINLSFEVLAVAG